MGLERRDPEVPLICLEAALATKFDDTIREALGREPDRPAGLSGIEELPQRFAVMDASPQAIKHYITDKVAPAR